VRGHIRVAIAVISQRGGHKLIRGTYQGVRTRFQRAGFAGDKPSRAAKRGSRISGKFHGPSISGDVIHPRNPAITATLSGVSVLRSWTMNNYY
jgi:hypothetical protein